MKKLISIFVTIILIASFFTFNASAAGTILAFSQNTITIGDKVVVTVTINTDEEMYSLGYKLVYDAEKLNYDGGAAAGTIKVVESPSGEKKYTKQFTFTSIAVGGAAIKVVDCEYAGIDFNNLKSVKGASATLTIKDVALPNNANLSSLTLSNGTLSPAFNANRINYTVSVPYEAANITLYAKTSDAKAKVALSTNPTNLNVGANTIKITVTAQDGSQKIYTVVVTRREQGATAEPPVVTPPTPENPYQTVISGKDYEIITTIPETEYLKGFTLSTTEYNGKQVPVLRDKDNAYTVYYLREVGSTQISPYTYNTELSTFEALKYITANDLLYIFAEFPEGVTMPDKYYSTYTQIGDYSVKVYMDSSAQMADFAYAYCFVNGNFGLYRYDSKEGSIQRFPDIHLIDVPTINNEPTPDNFASRFASLSTNGKVLIISLIIAAICLVLLIIFIIVMAIQKLGGSHNVPLIDELDFDDYTIVGEENSTDNK